ncbi:MAG TPA: hypothetical protein VKE69_04275 [Planctomycetota bacterium]|nr:hypothetical protein [Planctomycetota bacterium]
MNDSTSRRWLPRAAIAAGALAALGACVTSDVKVAKTKAVALVNSHIIVEPSNLEWSPVSIYQRDDLLMIQSMASTLEMTSEFGDPPVHLGIGNFAVSFASVSGGTDVMGTIQNVASTLSVSPQMKLKTVASAAAIADPLDWVTQTPTSGTVSIDIGDKTVHVVLNLP